MVYRNTAQRELVLNAVRTLRHHVSAEEVYHALVKDHPSIGRGTVYRNLNILAELGKIRKISIPGGPDRFDHTCWKHHHVQCIQCGSVFDVDLSDLPDLKGSVKNSHGIQIIDYDIIFKGLCPECQNKKKGENHER